jgi:molecular chaperone GrpE
MAETHHDRTTVPPREGEGGADRPDAEGEGDAQIRTTPPNVERTQPLDEEAVESGAGDDRAARTAGAEAAGSGAGTGSVEAERARAELASANDRYLRLAAEFDNYRKRSERERGELQTRIRGDVVARFVEVIDDLERVTGYDENTSAQALLEGVRLVDKKLRHVLQTLGVEVIDPVGEGFDPEIMEALMTVPAEHPEEDDVVADVFEKGYRIAGALVRPARVRVKKYE